MPNMIDRILLAAAPTWALERAKSRLQAQGLMELSGMQASAHDGDAGQGRAAAGTRWWRPRARDARADTLQYLPMQRGQSRDLARTSPIAGAAINTNVDRVVGTGLALSAQPNLFILGWTSEQATAWKRKVQAEFSLWADSPSCDICNTLDFYDQQALVLRSSLESGDCFTMMPDGTPTNTNPYKLRLQVLEADRVGNPGNKMDEPLVSGGIRTNDSGAPEACHVYDQHPGASVLSARGSIYAGNWVDCVGPSGRRRILHHFRKLRPGMPRGVPYLAPIVDLIKQLVRYTEAEITAAVISSFFTAFIETETGNSAPVFAGASGPEAAGDPIEMGSGAVVGLAKGEKVTFADPTRPNPNFDGFTLAMLRQVGMALGIPLELLIKQFNASYSASKAALLDAGIYFRTVRTWMARSFCQPVYETWLAEAVATGRISAPGFFSDPLMRWAYTRAAWNGDSMGSINPKDEVAAYTAAVDARLMTRERAEWELFGTDFNETFPAKKAEQDKLHAADLLPVPKAGAAAPQPSNKTNPAP